MLVLNPHQYSSFLASEPKFPARFHRLNDHSMVIVDYKTGDQWLSYGEEEFNFEKVKEYADGYEKRWSIPTIEELLELHSPNGIDPIFGLSDKRNMVWSCGKNAYDNRRHVFSYKYFARFDIDPEDLYQCFLIKRHDS